MPRPTKPIKRISSSIVSRSFALGKLSVKALAKSALTYTVQKIAGAESGPLRQSILAEQAALLAEELGKLKGSLMKAGQMLSVYGEHFFPPEINKYLRLLQKDSTPVQWRVIEKTIKRSLAAEVLARIEIENQPYAAASIGQVHRGKIIASGEAICLKVQYPGVDQVIDSDLSTLRIIFGILKFLPRGEHLDPVFDEIRSMLKREVDYPKELEATEIYRSLIAGDPRFVIPRTFPEYSGKRLIATSFEDGESLDSALVAELSEERRNALGMAALELFLKEFFVWGFVQTDPHFGNYRIRFGPPDQIVLLDFGAMRKFPKSFLQPYYDMVWGTFEDDRSRFENACIRLGMLEKASSKELQDLLYELARLVMEPFMLDPPNQEAATYFLADRRYDWGRTDLPDRVAKKLRAFLLTSGVRPPPKEFVFLDRKLAGVFIFLRQLKVVIPSHDCLLHFKSAIE